MAKHIDNEVKKTIKIIIQYAKFVSLTYVEVTSMDITSWASTRA
jgi:hypothetical protein